jgi:hypothetical protein
MLSMDLLQRLYLGVRVVNIVMIIGKAMQEAGIDSGMTQSATVASGWGRGKKHQQITVISTVQVLWPIVLDMILYVFCLSAS